MKRTGLLFLLTFCAVLVLVRSFETQALAQESNPRALSGAALDASLDPLPMPATTTPLQPTPTPTPAWSPARPALGKPAFSARTFYWGASACGPEQVTISVNASDPSSIASVQIHVRLASQSGKKKTDFMPLEMDPAGKAWTHTLNSWDIPGYNSSTLPWWLQFYFTATDNYGAQTQSSTYRNKIVLSSCVQLP
jgi:hypothetical protein